MTYRGDFTLPTEIMEWVSKQGFNILRKFLSFQPDNILWIIPQNPLFLGIHWDLQIVQGVFFKFKIKCFL
jgi:hypothetical protein